MPKKPQDIIIKVQRSGDGQSVLIYDEKETFTVPGPYTKALHKKLRMKPLTKKYFHSYIDSKKILQIGAQAPEQDW